VRGILISISTSHYIIICGKLRVRGACARIACARGLSACIACELVASARYECEERVCGEARHVCYVPKDDVQCKQGE
jgi:hypothetical protein